MRNWQGKFNHTILNAGFQAFKLKGQNKNAVFAAYEYIWKKCHFFLDNENSYD